MSESRPITTPPRRRNNLLAHVQHVFSGNSGVGGGGGGDGNGDDSSSAIDASPSFPSRNGTIRKLEPYHHALLESGCQSAKSSPLPHRRLDKLVGVIRDGQVVSPLSGCMTSKVMDHRFINNHQESPMPYRRQSHTTKSSFHFHHNDNGGDNDMSSDAHSYGSNGSPMDMSTLSRHHRGTFRAAAVKSANFFNHHEDVNHHHQQQQHVANFASPIKNRLGEPGVFASPARSICSSRINSSSIDDINYDDEIAIQPHADQSIVSGWLKFRDNKRVSDFAFSKT